MRILVACVVLLVGSVSFVACGAEESKLADSSTPGGHVLLGRDAERVLADPRPLPDPEGGLAAVTVDYPEEGSVFPPGFVPPTFLWHDASDEALTWWVHVAFDAADVEPIDLLVPGVPPPTGVVDPEAIGKNNELYRPTPYQASARSWTPSAHVWTTIQTHSRERWATLTIVGLTGAIASTPCSTGRVRLRTSADPVGAPIFYRDVPLMPAVSVGDAGVIQPLSQEALPVVAWRLKDVSRPGSKLLLTGMPSCANCHSFTRDGKTLAMDVDGPQGDKGAYAVAPIQPSMRIDRDHVFTWNSFPDKPPDHKTIGFLSRISPDGRYVISTVNETLYVANFPDHEFLQVFYPTRGILAWTSTETGEMRALPGADAKAYVHCDPVWTPDGETIVFARGRARDAYEEGVPRARHPNDPNEPEMKYDLVRMPFDEGRGGPRTKIEGASDNGMSNTFPKVSPDGRWVVFVKCRNGQLLRPDGRLWIVPLEGGEAREMRCNQRLMNSWHSFSPNGRWMVFSSKANTPYTEMFLTHIDEEGNDTPGILIPGATAANRAVNIPEFLNAPFDALNEIAIPAADHHLHYQRGQALIEEGRLAEARPHFLQALAVNPSFSRAHAALGSIEKQIGSKAKALERFEDALAAGGVNSYVLTNLGELLFERGDVERAADAWRRAVEVAPYDPAAYNDLGLALASLHRFDEAEHALRRALALDPRHAQAHANLGVLEAERGRYDLSRRHFEDALELEPDNRRYRLGLATAQDACGLPGKAVEQYETILRERPGDVSVLRHLAWTLATTPDETVRDGRRALAYAEQAMQRTGGRDALVLDALAAALARIGDFRAAAEIAARARAGVGDDDPERVRGIEERLRLYRGGRPYTTRR